MCRLVLIAFTVLVAITATVSLSPAAELEVVASLPVGPGGITVTPDKQIIVGLHPFFSPKKQVVRITPDGKMVPFPNEAWNRRSSQSDTCFDSVIGVQCDPNGIVWMLDSGMRSWSSPKLVAWDLVKNVLHRIIHLTPPVITLPTLMPDNAFLNDLAVDVTHQAIYISRSGGPGDSGLIVVNLQTGTARQVLTGHPGVEPENVDIVMSNRILDFTLPDSGRLKLLIGVNPLVLDCEDKWLYFGAMNGKSLYRIRAADLLDTKVTEEELGRRVERYADKPVCDGISIDNAGNIYISDIEVNAIGVIAPDKSYKRMLTDPRISWPESFSFGPDGYLYFVAGQLHLSPPLNGGKNESKKPFHVFRVRPLAPGIAGR